MSERRTHEQHSGQLRPEEFPEIMGNQEVVDCSGRSSSSAVAHYRDTYPDFPKPIAVLAGGPVYLGSEIRPFWDKYPAQRRLTADEVQRIRQLATTPADDEAVAQLFKISPVTVASIRKGIRGKRVPQVRDRRKNQHREGEGTA